MTFFRVLTFAFVSLCSLLHSVQAGSIVIGETKELLPPSAAVQESVEFYLDRTDADDGTPLSVGNFQLRVDLSGADAGSAVRILGVGPTSTRSQAFALDTMDVTGGTSGYAATFNLASAFEIADGAGLLKIDLEVMPSASGDYTLSVLSGTGNTEFTDPIDFATLLPVAVGSAALSVAVPEPSCLCLAMLGSVAVAIRRKRAFV